jgi:hypothetical protein
MGQVILVLGSFALKGIGGILASVLASSVVDHGFENLLGQTKDYEIGICCYSVKHVALRSKNKDYMKDKHQKQYTEL